MPTCRAVKKDILEILKDPAWEERLHELLERPLKKVLHPLFASLCNKDPEVKWHGITAFGLVADHIAQSSMEQARIIMRRLMWSLNDESGGIGWGAPEAMAEIMAVNERLAKEFHKVFLSYIHEEESGEDNYLELDALRRGAVWGIGRLSQVRPGLTKKCLPELLPSLEESDPVLRGLACWAVGEMQAKEAEQGLLSLTTDTTSLTLYKDRRLIETTVGELANEALQGLK